MAIDLLINAPCKRIVLPGVFIAKLPETVAQVAEVGLHPPVNPTETAIAGQPAQHGHGEV